MIDKDRLELTDTGDGVPLTKCEQNLYEALANVQDGWYYEFDESVNHACRDNTMVRLEDAFADMSELVAEVERLREQLRLAKESPYQDYEQWTVAQLDENNMKIGEEEFEYEEQALEAYRYMICEYSPTLGARLSHHTNWEMIDGMLTSHTWTTIDTHEAGVECDCVNCCTHPSCATTGICVPYCDECNGQCEVKE